jgi:ATP-binding cassette subfamily C protein CydCD
VKPLDPRLLPHLRPALVPLAGVVVASVVSGGLVIAQAFAVAAIITALLDGTTTEVAHAGVVLVALTSGRALAALVADLCAARASLLVTTSLRRRIVTAALALGALGLSRRRSGDLALLSTRGVAAVDPYLTRYLPALVLAAVLPALTVLAIATQDLASALVVVATLPLVPVFAILIGTATRDRADRQWHALSALSGHFVDVMRGLPTLVAYRRATAQSASIRRITDRYRRATNDTLKLAFASSAVLELVATISVALVAVLVGLRLSAGSLDLGTALVVLLLAPEAYWPLRRVGAEFHAAAEGTSTFEAAHELLATIPARSVAGRIEHPVGQITIRSLTVSYPDRMTPALRGLSAVIEPFGITAITGPSGSGKSTLLAALTGELPAKSGSIRIGEVDLASLDRESWQSRIAWIPQRPWILPGTVRENVLLARPSASDTEIWSALERVALGELVAALPAGLDEPIGEDGSGLSAGERARLALARAVVAERPLVLLDEPTAHLDPVTEQVITETLRWLARRSAVVVVAHRPSIVDLADHVIPVPASQKVVAPTEGATAGGAEGAQRTQGAARSVTTTKESSECRAPAQPGPLSTGRTKSRLHVGTALGALAAASGVALTATAGWLIARAAEHPPVLMLMVAIVGVRTFGLARPALRYAERLVSHDVALRLLAERRAAVYDALVPLVPGRLGRQRGDVLSSIVDDVDALVDKQLRVRAPLLAFGAVSAVAIVFATLVLPAAGVVLSGFLLVGGGLAYGTSRFGVARAEREFVDRRAELSSRVVQTIQGASDLAMWQATGRASSGIDAVGIRIAAAGTRSVLATSTGKAAAMASAGLAMMAMAGVGSTALAQGAVSGPMLALLVLLPLALLDVLTPLTDAGALQVRTSAADARLRALTRTEAAVTDPESPLPLDWGDPTIRLETVGAGWGMSPAFQDQSLHIAPGAHVGVVGPSGSGKSTLAAVLLRFLDPMSGSVNLGATNTRDLLLDDVRRMVGLVDDDPHIFASSLRENLRLAQPDASSEEIEVALRAAQLEAWTSALPEGLDTMIGDGYAHVSGGERARIGLARAILADQPVLVLDEPTAHLDTATAQTVSDDLLDAAGGRSIVWITHGTIGLDRMDSVLRLGRVSELAGTR